MTPFPTLCFWNVRYRYVHLQNLQLRQDDYHLVEVSLAESSQMLSRFEREALSVSGPREKRPKLMVDE